MDAIVTIEDLKTCFFLDEGTVQAVDGVDLQIPRGKTLCVVGESGCGKSITALSLLRMIAPPGQIVDGRITLHREDGNVVLTDLDEDGEEIRAIRGREIAMLFQEPMTSRSPVHSVGSQIKEAVELHTGMRKTVAREHVVYMMSHVGIPDAARRFAPYPHAMSGGLRQRAMSAMALSCRPSLLIADEPTGNLDTENGHRVLELLRKLHQETSAAVLLATHDRTIASAADRVLRMQDGVEVVGGRSTSPPNGTSTL